MDPLTKSEIELNLIKYFSEFEKDGLIIPLIKTTEIHSKTENEIYFSREYNLDYDKELFEKFFQKKIAAQNVPFERFIEVEKMRFEKKFKPLKQDPNYAIIGHWIYFLDKKLKDNIEVKPNDEVKTENTDLPEIELKTQKEQIRLLYDLGIIDFLQKEFEETLKGNENQTASLIAKILKLKTTSIQPTLNALLSNNVNKNYPSKTPTTKAIIDKLNANKLK